MRDTQAALPSASRIMEPHSSCTTMFWQDVFYGIQGGGLGVLVNYNYFLGYV